MKRNPARRCQAGFTLIELLVAVGTFSVLLVFSYKFYRTQLFAFRTEEAGIRVKQGADLALDLIVKELRLAGGRPVPEGYPPPGCSIPVSAAVTVPPCSGFEAITRADSDHIALQYDFHGSSAGSAANGCPDDTDESIEYSYDSSIGSILRAVNAGAAQTVVSNVPAGGLAFQYFDASGALLSAPVDADGRAKIQRISVTITVRSPHPDPHIGGVIRSTKTSAVFLRNPPC